MGTNHKYLVLDGTGFLGRYFASNLLNSSVVHTSGKNKNQFQSGQIRLEVTKYSEPELDRIFSEYSFSHVINCVGLTDIQMCEQFPEQADWLNRALPSLLARQSLRHGFRLIHISTDAVFDGSKPNRTEVDSPKPTNVYAVTKHEGELEIIGTNPSALITRVNFVGRSPIQKSLFDFFQQNLSARNPIQGYSNV